MRLQDIQIAQELEKYHFNHNTKIQKTMLKKLIEIINKANESYVVHYEESSLMNVRADDLLRSQPFVHIEEFKSGKVSTSRYGLQTRTMKMEIYFGRFCEFENNATTREEMREQIIEEVVYPFMTAYNKSGYFQRLDEWEILYPLTRFDANEVAVMLNFKCVIPEC